MQQRVKCVAAFFVMMSRKNIADSGILKKKARSEDYEKSF